MDDSQTNDPSAAVYAKLRGLFSSLPPETCAKIMAFFEQIHQAGQTFPGYEMITGELAAIIASRPTPARRNATLQRRFFAPLEPFLIDETLGEKRLGRIERGSLTPLWQWVVRDFAPGAFAQYEQSNDLDGFNAVVLPKLSAFVTAHDDLAHRKSIVQMGGPRVFEDLKDMMTVVNNHEVLRQLSERIVGPIRQVDDHQARVIAAALAPFARGDAGLMPHSVAMILPKLSAPWQVIRAAIFALESDSGTLIAQSPFRAVVEVTLTDLERLMARAEHARDHRDNETFAAATADFAAYVKALVTELEILPEQPWARRLGTLRARMGNLLRPDLDTLPGRIRALLRARAAEYSGRKAGIDEEECASIEAFLNILVIAKQSASELASNEVTMRVFNEVQQYLDVALNPLIEGLRPLGGEDRAHRLLQLDAAVKFAYRIRGAAFATLLAKSIDVASSEKRVATRSA